MAKIAAESRELFNKKIQPYKDMIQKSFEKEDSLVSLIAKDVSGIAYKKMILCEITIFEHYA